MRYVLDEVGPPAGEIFRVGWYDDPLGPPPWHKAGLDGTFGNRFDDPGAAGGIPKEDRFRCVYFGSTAEAAFGEALAGFRVSIDTLAHITTSVRDAESLREMFTDVVDFEDPNVPARGIVPAEWRERRRLARTTLHPSLRFANIATRSSNQYVRTVLADKAAELNLHDGDFSTMLSASLRTFTQALHATFTNCATITARIALTAFATCLA